MAKLVDLSPSPSHNFESTKSIDFSALLGVFALAPSPFVLRVPVDMQCTVKIGKEEGSVDCNEAKI